MAKLAAIVLLLVALAASASAYTTVVTTTVTEEANPRKGQSCSTEMQQKMPMKQCMMWMEKKMRGPYSFEFDDAFLRSAVANPRLKEEHLQQCCSEIKQFSTGCQCDAVKEMMTEMPQGEMEEVEETVRMLPRMCGISGCRI